jgi:hypothetical protein
MEVINGMCEEGSRSKEKRDRKQETGNGIEDLG